MKNGKKWGIWLLKTLAVLLLLLGIQWLTKPAGVWVNGLCINAVLAASALLLGLWGSLIAGGLFPILSYFLEIGADMVMLIPAEVMANLAFLVLLLFVLSQKERTLKLTALSLVAASAGKFLLQYLSVCHVLIAAMGPALSYQAEADLRKFYSWPQLITSFAGGALGVGIVYAVNWFKANKK